MTDKLRDLKINGAGSASGGEYNEVTVNGAGKIDGPLTCWSYKTNGASELQGNLECTNCKINGAASINGNTQAEEIKINGSCTFRGEVTTKLMEINGSCDIDHGIMAEQIIDKGYFKVKKDCSAEEFKSKGGFSIGGLLNAGNIEITIYGKCTAREIGGEKILIKDGPLGLHKFLKSLFSYSDHLLADVIEGDDIKLENTVAKVVRGNNVTIGPGSNIDLVEYQGEIKISKNAHVKEYKKI